MKQRHSYLRLYYHLVFSTANREHLIRDPADLRSLHGYFISKVKDVDGYLDEFGGWHDHVHLLLHAGAARALSEVYGQLKGYSSRSWNRRHPNRPFGWSDGVYAATVDPDAQSNLRAYIRDQWRKHDHRDTLDCWEPEEFRSPSGLVP